MSWMLIAPGIAFFVLALVFWRVRNGVESAPPDPPGVRSVVEWAGPVVPESDDTTPGAQTADGLASALRQRGFAVEPCRDLDYAWEFDVAMDGTRITVAHGYNGDGPWLTLARPQQLPVLGVQLSEWKRLLTAVDELLPELGAVEMHWFRHEDHHAGARGPTWSTALD